MSAAIELRGVTKRYGRTEALSAVSLHDSAARCSG
jgi:ABC-type sugar transport system ATPase subunit